VIVGVFIKGYKTYKRTQFIPVSAGHPFTAYVGPNGAGKSSVLEALGTYFNDTPWIVNKSAKEDGHLTNFINFPYVCPVFVIEKARFEKARKAACPGVSSNVIDAISDYLWTVESKDARNAPNFASFAALRESLSGTLKPSDHYLLASGIRAATDKEISPTHFGPFHAQSSFLSAIGIQRSEEELQLERARENDEAVRNIISGDLNSAMRYLYDFIHIPSDVVIADFTKLETGTMQLLMGRSIGEEVRKAIPPATLTEINKSLEQTVEAAVQGLDEYSYERPTGSRKNITHTALAKLITKEFFSIRELSWDDGGGHPTPVSNLSSGEQRRALVDVAANYLKSGAVDHQQTIFAIDEPEISLHTSRCYDQFEILFDVARAGVQTIITTHWYGFLPIAQEGAAHFLERRTDEIVCETYDLSNYKEKASKALQLSKGSMPFDLSLKSINDLVQSIASSLRLEKPYSWILCEGSSEKIYLSYMLAAEIAAGRLRLLPLGGAGRVVEILRFLEVALGDKTFKSKGKVIALIDTDAQTVPYTKLGESASLLFRRLLLPVGESVQLILGDSTTVSPPTTIEDVLNAEAYVATLRSFGKAVPVDIDANVSKGAIASGHALDLKTSEREKMNEFFAEPGRKTEFARAYVDVAGKAKALEPLHDLLVVALS
jgi:hypothetical protein